MYVVYKCAYIYIYWYSYCYICNIYVCFYNCIYSYSHISAGTTNTISAEQSGIVTTIDGIDSRMNDLKALFRKGDPLERRFKAATTITAHIRGFLCRTRLAHFQSALIDWKWTRWSIRFLLCALLVTLFWCCSVDSHGILLVYVFLYCLAGWFLPW
jgi:hypothetical protein